jgi:hypothetical protein
MIDVDDRVWIRGGVRKSVQPEAVVSAPDLTKEQISQHARKIIDRLRGLSCPEFPEVSTHREPGDDNPWV